MQLQDLCRLLRNIYFTAPAFGLCLRINEQCTKCSAVFVSSYSNIAVGLEDSLHFTDLQHCADGVWFWRATSKGKLSMSWPCRSLTNPTVNLVIIREAGPGLREEVVQLFALTWRIVSRVGTPHSSCRAGWNVSSELYRTAFAHTKCLTMSSEASERTVLIHVVIFPVFLFSLFDFLHHVTFGD